MPDSRSLEAPREKKTRVACVARNITINHVTENERMIQPGIAILLFAIDESQLQLTISEHKIKEQTMKVLSPTCIFHVEEGGVKLDI